MQEREKEGERERERERRRQKLNKSDEKYCNYESLTRVASSDKVINKTGAKKEIREEEI